MLGIVILIYNSKDNAISLVGQIRALCKIPYRIVIVDNTPEPIFQRDITDSLKIPVVSMDDTVMSQSDAYYLPTHKNTGFASGNNTGAKFLEKYFPNIKYLLFSNDDILLDSGDVFISLCRKIDADPQIGCIGPRIIGPDHLDHSPRKRILSLYRLISIYLLYPLHELVKLFKPHPSEIYSNTLAPEGACCWLLGAFMMFPRKVFDAIGMFDSETFLYCEEIIIAAKLSKFGKINYFLPTEKVLHLDGASTGKTSTYQQSWQLHLSQKIYFRKYEHYSKVMLALFDFAFWWFHHIWNWSK